MKNMLYKSLIVFVLFLTGADMLAQAKEIVVTPYSTTLIADGKHEAKVKISLIDARGKAVTDAEPLITFTITGDMSIANATTQRPGEDYHERSSAGIWKVKLYNGECMLTVRAGKTSGMSHFEAKGNHLQKGETDFITISPEKDALVSVDKQYELKGEAALPRPVDKMIGADISFLPQLEAQGIKFSDNEVKKDAITILKDHGFNYIRLRIFNEPSNEKGYSPGKGFCDLAQTKAMAKRIKANGMKLLLDFHYSDTWADPGKQFKPKAWEKLSFKDLKKAVYDYTKDVISQLKAQGTTPDMVQIGNEINHGFLWPEGSVANPNDMAQLYSAGVAGVKAVDVTVPIMLHIALGGQHPESVQFLDGMVKRGAHFDVIGQSYYPKWHGTLSDLENNLYLLAKRYKKDIIVVEYSQLKEEVNRIAFEVTEGRGKGTCIWEPLNTWERIFDEAGEPNEYLGVFDKISRQFMFVKQ